VRKTFCDRCGAECVNTIGRIWGSVDHQTKAGEHVGNDELRPTDLCKACMDWVVEALGLKLVPVMPLTEDSSARYQPHPPQPGLELAERAVPDMREVPG
jgi:hypothetical protein